MKEFLLARLIAGLKSDTLQEWLLRIAARLVQSTEPQWDDRVIGFLSNVKTHGFDVAVDMSLNHARQMQDAIKRMGPKSK